MNVTDALKSSLGSTKFLLNWFVSDLSDADLLVRAVPSANTIAWQMGHLVLTEVNLIGKHLPGATPPALPADFAAKHSKDRATADDGFLTKAEYVSLFGTARDATIEAVGKLSEADLDRPIDGPIAKFAPTVGALLILASNHVMMHAGQFSVVRRKLGKPVLF